MPKLRKDALDEVVADRLARQAKKSVKQLQAELSHKSSCKVGGLGVKATVQKVDLSYIPGREVVKENQRAIARRKQMEAEAQARREAASV
jgi:1,6-anhydro-N-acetylmuramate kinase